MTGSTGYGGGSTGNKNMRGVDPSMKHIPGHHRFQQFTPEQMELYQSLYGHVGPESYLGRLAGGDEEIFRQIEQPKMKQFSGLQGGIASRFGGMGMGSGGIKSSGFQNTQNQAAMDFASQLQANRQGLQRQALGDIMSYSQMLLGQQPYGLQEKQQRQPSGWGALAGTALGAGAGFAMGGPWGAFQGAQLGYGVGSQF